MRYFHPDHLGSSSTITDAAGALVEETAYHPFGVPRHEHRSRDVEEPYQFTQKERDRESRLHYFESRYLAGHLARFTRLDHKYANIQSLSKEDFAAALAIPQKWNLYAYVGNNPLRYVDPMGEDAAKPQPEGSSASLTSQNAGSAADEIPVDSASFDPNATQGGAGRVRSPDVSENPPDLIVTRSMDSRSPDLAKYYHESKSLGEVTLTVTGPRAPQGGYLMVKLTDVMITSMSIDNSVAGKPPTETFILSSKGMKLIHPKAPEPKPPAPQDQVSRHVNPFAPPPKMDADRAVAMTVRYFRDILAGGNSR